MLMRRVFPLALAMLAGVSCNESVRTETVFLEADGLEKNCYTAVLPAEGQSLDSFMLLFPGFGETMSDVLSATSLPSDAAASGIAVFIPLLQDGVESYGFSNQSQESLSSIVDDIIQRYDLEGMPYCVGGFSMGGATAVKYAETVEVKPSCVFAIDSPLDYQRYVYSTRRDVEVYRKGLAEGGEIYTRLLEDLAPIAGESPYLLSDMSHEAILPLADIPVRYYIEPAEQWWLDMRQTDVLGLNILDGTAFINDLRLLGNDNAELIVTSGKGYRNSGKTYHPHSWTIVDNAELIAWIKNSL